MKVYEIGRKDQEEPFWIASEKPIKTFESEEKCENIYVKEIDVNIDNPSIDFKISSIPETITEDRERIYKIIDEMLENPDKHGLYQTTKCMNEFEDLLESVRVQALGYAWSIACGYMEDCEDIREIDQAGFLDKALKQLNKKGK